MYYYNISTIEVKRNMKGYAKVQVQQDKKRNTIRYLIYIPSNIVKLLDVKKGNILEFDFLNPRPEYVDPIGKGANFQKKPLAIPGIAKHEELQKVDDTPEPEDIEWQG